MKTFTRGKLTADEIRDGCAQFVGLNTMGLTESPCWIDGFQFTCHTTPRAAVDSYLEIKGVMPVRYFIDPTGSKFNLAH